MFTNNTKQNDVDMSSQYILILEAYKITISNACSKGTAHNATSAFFPKPNQYQTLAVRGLHI